MFTRTAQQTRQQTAQQVTQRATAFGLAALVTLAMLGSVHQLAGAPSRYSLLAAGSTQMAHMAQAKMQPQT